MDQNVSRTKIFLYF